MITIYCLDCVKEFKVSGADFNERNLNKIKPLCQECASKPVKSKKVDKKKTWNIDKEETPLKLEGTLI